MAEYDEYGNPSQFLKIVKNFKAEQGKLESQIQHKTLLLKDIENETTEKKEEICQLKESVQIRQDSINYNNMMNENLKFQLRSAKETEQLLRCQVTVAKDHHELEKEENNRLINSCKEIYDSFEEKLESRRNYYKANRPLAEVIFQEKQGSEEAEKKIQEKEKVIEKLAKEHSLLIQLKKGAEKSLTEWGFNLAIMMVELNSSDIKDQFQINKSLLRENTELKEKESKKIQENNLKLTSQTELFKIPHPFSKKTNTKPPTNFGQKSDYFFKTGSVPSFNSFFKDKMPHTHNMIPSQGSSGLFCGMATSMPNIANIKEKEPDKMEKQSNSLSDWLNGTNVKAACEENQKSNQTIKEKTEKPLNSKTSLDRRVQWSDMSDNTLYSDNVDRDSNMDVGTNLLHVYDGEIYEKPVKGDTDCGENASNMKCFQSPKSSFDGLSMDHREIMAGFRESPENDYMFQQQTVRMEGVDQGYLMSPDARNADFQFNQPNFFNQSCSNFEQTQPGVSCNAESNSGFSFKFDMSSDSSKNEAFSFGGAESEGNMFSNFGSNKSEINPFSFSPPSHDNNKENSFSSMFGFGK